MKTSIVSRIVLNGLLVCKSGFLNGKNAWLTFYYVLPLIFNFLKM